MAQEQPMAHKPTGTGKDKSAEMPPPNPPGSLGSGMELANEEPKARKAREKVPVVIMKEINVGGQHGNVWKPVQDEKVGGDLFFKNTAEADAWVRANRADEKHNGERYRIMPVNRDITIKVEKILKVTF